MHANEDEGLCILAFKEQPKSISFQRQDDLGSFHLLHFNLPPWWMTVESYILTQVPWFDVKSFDDFILISQQMSLKILDGGGGDGKSTSNACNSKGPVSAIDSNFIATKMRVRELSLIWIQIKMIFTLKKVAA